MTHRGGGGGEGVIWWYALGYFACYAPYSALTKLASSSALLGAPLSGLEILPLSTATSLLAMLVFLVGTGWWREASRVRVLGVWMPVPTRWTVLSGLCSAAIVVTTTLSYAFAHTSILLMMLLMRGGVLMLAPLVDAAGGRRARPASWAALLLSLVAVVVAAFPDGRLHLTAAAVVDVSVYLGAYFLRLRFMTHLAKSKEAHVNLRFFVEEQLVAMPVVVGALVLLAVFAPGALGWALRRGFGVLDFSVRSGVLALIGVLSEGTGIFGALILLDHRESTFCVPINRASSMLAGLLGTTVLAALALGVGATVRELAGAALVVGAVGVLAVFSGRGISGTGAAPRSES